MADLLTNEQIALLTEEIPITEVSWRSGRNYQYYAFLRPPRVIERLNQAFGWNWDYQVSDWEIINWEGRPFEVRVLGTLTVRVGNQTIVKQQFGAQAIEYTKNGEPVSIAEAFKAAATDALKKCAAMLGIGLSVYDPDSYEIPEEIRRQLEEERRGRYAGNIVYSPKPQTNPSAPQTSNTTPVPSSKKTAQSDNKSTESNGNLFEVNIPQENWNSFRDYLAENCPFYAWSTNPHVPDTNLIIRALKHLGYSKIDEQNKREAYNKLVAFSKTDEARALKSSR